MKKKIFGSIAVIAIAAVAAFNVNFNTVQDNNLSGVSLANVEALASSESSGRTCYNSITTMTGSQILYCGTCSYVSGTASWTSGTSKC